MYHYHKCRCGYLWQHSDSQAGNEKAHTCICGKEVWDRYSPTRQEIKELEAK